LVKAIGHKRSGLEGRPAQEMRGLQPVDRQLGTFGGAPAYVYQAPPRCDIIFGLVSSNPGIGSGQFMNIGEGDVKTRAGKKKKKKKKKKWPPPRTFCFVFFKTFQLKKKKKKKKKKGPDHLTKKFLPVPPWPHTHTHRCP
jgi:hypothetical protein